MPSVIDSQERHAQLCLLPRANAQGMNDGKSLEAVIGRPQSLATSYSQHQVRIGEAWKHACAGDNMVAHQRIICPKNPIK